MSPRSRMYVGDQVATEDLETRLEDLEARINSDELGDLRARCATLERRSRAMLAAYDRLRLDSAPSQEDWDLADLARDALAMTAGARR